MATFRADPPPWNSESAAVEACVRVTGHVDPDPAWRERYAEGYAAFTRLYPAIAGLRAAGG